MNLQELIKLGFVALKETIDLIRSESNSVNIEQRMNELDGDLFAVKGYCENLVAENTSLKVGKLRADNENKELKNELEKLRELLEERK